MEDIMKNSSLLWKKVLFGIIAWIMIIRFIIIVGVWLINIFRPHHDKWNVFFFWDFLLFIGGVVLLWNLW